MIFRWAFAIILFFLAESNSDRACEIGTIPARLEASLNQAVVFYFVRTCLKTKNEALVYTFSFVIMFVDNVTELRLVSWSCQHAIKMTHFLQFVSYFVSFLVK